MLLSNHAVLIFLFGCFVFVAGTVLLQYIQAKH